MSINQTRRDHAHIEQQVGAVIIGRNEGQRLVSCLKSLINNLSMIVYVDSGSTDDSVEFATELGVHVLSLDMSIPFTAARARNEGANYLIKYNSNLSLIQFVDGDCEVDQDWVKKAVTFLNENIDYAVVCGRRRERFPENSIYNQLCDLEWNTPIGDAFSCGGDALLRVSAFKQIKGYNGILIAGEEPEMCFRLRQLNWKIKRIDAEMTLHDAAMTSVGQWWKRAKRAGYAYASSFYLHGNSVEKFKRKEVLSIIFWAGALPIVIVVLALYSPLFIILCALYPIQIIKVAIKCHHQNLETMTVWFYAVSTVMAKFPQFSGILKFGLNRLRGRDEHLIEYK